MGGTASVDTSQATSLSRGDSLSSNQQSLDDETDKNSSNSQNENEENGRDLDPVAAAYSTLSKCVNLNKVRFLKKKYLQQDTIEGPSAKESRLSDVMLIEMGMALRDNNTITSIDLRHQRIEKRGLLFLLKELHENSTLTSLELSDNMMGCTDTIESILFEDNSVTCAALTKLISSEVTVVEAVNLEMNQLSPEDGVMIGESLASNSSLKMLRLNDNSVSNSGALAIGTSLQSHKSLVFLDLSNNNIGAEGVKSLADALQSPVIVLRYLYLERNCIGAAGCKILASGLASNETLKSLSLWKNDIGNAGAKYLASVLHSNLSLTELNVGDNKIDTDGIRALFKALERNVTLKNLMLWYNTVDETAVNIISTALKSNIHLEGLNLHTMSGFTGPLILVLASALKYNSKLLTLDIGGNNSFNDDVKRLFLIFLRDSRVSALNMVHGIVLTDFIDVLGIEYSADLTNSSILCKLKKRRVRIEGKPKVKKRYEYVTREKSFDLEAIVRKL